MKFKVLISSIILSIPLLSPGQPSPAGQVIEGLAMASTILGRDVHYSIYLPPDYATGKRAYPVVYLLHGYTDNETAWVQFGEVNRTADKEIASGDIPPMIIVMPDGGVTWYINNADGTERYEDMFVSEFIPYIDKTYRTRSTREFRGVSGLSMGGHGSLVYALKHPDLFSACAAFSSAVWTEDEVKGWKDQDRNGMFVKLFGITKDKTLLTDHFKANNAFSLAGSLPKEQIEKVRFYIDCGDDDFLYKGNSALHVLLRDRQVAHEYRVRDGGHTWVYWRTGIGDGLRFIGEGFHR